MHVPVVGGVVRSPTYHESDPKQRTQECMRAVLGNFAGELGHDPTSAVPDMHVSLESSRLICIR